MPEAKKKLNMLGTSIDVAEVPITSSEELLNTYKLEDGSVLKVKNVATSVMRVEGQFLPDGRPVYLVFSTPVVNVESHTITNTQQRK